MQPGDKGWQQSQGRYKQWKRIMLFTPFSFSAIVSEKREWQISKLPRKPSFELKLCHRAAWRGCPEPRPLGLGKEEEGTPGSRQQRPAKSRAKRYWHLQPQQPFPGRMGEGAKLRFSNVIYVFNACYFLLARCFFWGVGSKSARKWIKQNASVAYFKHS